jgi:superfamily I DNA and/or RNA helicase
MSRSPTTAMFMKASRRRSESQLSSDDLLRMKVRQKDGGIRPLQATDILVVALYNLQVRRLARRLAPIRVGSVDKFQGQEAPVVIFSMRARRPANRRLAESNFCSAGIV